MRRPREHLLGRSALDHLAAHHHQHAVAEIAHHRQVVRDDQDRDAALAAQRRKQVQKLRLHRHIEPGHDLVCDQDARHGAERARNVDALALAAGRCAGNRVAASGGSRFRAQQAGAREPFSQVAWPAASSGW